MVAFVIDVASDQRAIVLRAAILPVDAGARPSVDHGAMRILMHGEGYMLSRSRLPALLLIGILPLFACQLLVPAPQSCRVNLPGIGWVEHQHGDTISFTVDKIVWSAQVDCKLGHLVEGQPARPERAREFQIPVEQTTYRLITADTDIFMAEYRDNGSHVRIEHGKDYYVAALSAAPAAMGQAMISYFMVGQRGDAAAHLYCYNHTEGAEQTSLPVIAAMWSQARPATVSLVCSGRDFILEITAPITEQMLSQGPTP